MPLVTRTLNPLHFEDLEPKRFEDLARQLVYDLRDWYRIEATGRTGGDEGIDIRATERVPSGQAPEEAVEEDAETQLHFEERAWIVQCKREREIGPARVEEIVNESVPEGSTPPYGFAIVAASDLSLKSRERFRALMNARKVQEYFVWGKAELEDQLYQSRNDHLLFAYFGISLQARRRSVKTAFSARLSTKRRLLKVLDCGLRERGHTPVLVRDAAATDYPRGSDVSAKGEPLLRRWQYYEPIGHLRVDQLALLAHEYLGWADLKTEQWDAYEAVDVGIPKHQALWMTEEQRAQREREEPIRRFWNTRVPQQNRVHLYVVGFIPYDRVILVDEVGDTTYPGPHLIVDCSGLDGPFSDTRQRIEPGYEIISDQGFFPNASRRITFFPEPLPDIPQDEFLKAIGADSPG